MTQVIIIVNDLNSKGLKEYLESRSKEEQFKVNSITNKHATGEDLEYFNGSPELKLMFAIMETLHKAVITVPSYWDNEDILDAVGVDGRYFRINSDGSIKRF